jgi:hypothetical protein
MFSIEFSASIDENVLDKEEIEITCPECNFYNIVLFKQIKFNDAVICRGCNITLQLMDFLGEVSKAEKNLKDQIKSINNLFK